MPVKASPEDITKYIAVFGAFVASIHLIPGPWRRWDRGAVIDNWTWTHLLWGYIGQRMNQNFRQQMTLAVTNELFEALIRRYRPEWLWAAPEKQANILADVAANAVGWGIGSKIHPRGRS